MHINESEWKVNDKLSIDIYEQWNWLKKKEKHELTEMNIKNDKYPMNATVNQAMSYKKSKVESKWLAGRPFPNRMSSEALQQSKLDGGCSHHLTVHSWISSPTEV